MSSAFRPCLALAPILLCLALAAGACSDDDTSGSGPAAAPPAQSTEEPTTFVVRATATYGRVVGQLGERDRQALKGKISRVVDGWFDAAYVGGEYPRSDFRDAFRGFTPGAMAEARRDLRLMTNKGIGRRVERITTKQSAIRLDVLTVRRVAVGVTAHVLLRFTAEGERTRQVRVAGRLFLSRHGTGWKVFGYDVAKGARA